MPCSKPTPSPFPVIVLPRATSSVPFMSTPSPPNCWPSIPLCATVESLSVVPTAYSESKSPARALPERTQWLTETPLPCLIQTPLPPWLVTLSRSSVMLWALSTAIPCGAFASTLTPRTTRSWTPESITPTLASGGAIVTGPSAWNTIGNPGVPETTGRSCAA